MRKMFVEPGSFRALIQFTLVNPLSLSLEARSLVRTAPQRELFLYKVKV